MVKYTFFHSVRTGWRKLKFNTSARNNNRKLRVTRYAQNEISPVSR